MKKKNEIRFIVINSPGEGFYLAHPDFNNIFSLHLGSKFEEFNSNEQDQDK